MAQQVWIPEALGPLMSELRAELNGHLPIIHVIYGQQPKGPGCLYGDIYYPELFIPNGPDGHWQEVANAITHLIDSARGVPYLRSSTPALDARATMITSEISHIAYALEPVIGIQTWFDRRLLEKVRDHLKSRDECEGWHTYFLIKLHRMQLVGHPDAKQAIELWDNAYPVESKIGKETFDQLVLLPLRTPVGREKAIDLLLKAVGLKSEDFSLQTARSMPGTTAVFQVGHFQALEASYSDFIKGARAKLQLRFKLPFELPVPEGQYELDESSIFLRHENVNNARASFQTGQGMNIQSVMSPTGLYQITDVEISLPPELSVDQTSPPSDVMYENHKIYPEAIKQSTLLLNRLIAHIRSDGRCDLPEIVPPYLSQISYKKPDGRTGVLSLEYNCVTEGPLPISESILSTPQKIKEVPLERQFLDSAKFHLLAFNSRRAMLDFAAALEAFLEKYITPQIVDTITTTKQDFVRLYGASLQPEIQAFIQGMPVTSEDKERPKSIYFIMNQYKKMRVIELTDGILNPIKKAYQFRNPAAHGKPIPLDIQEILAAAIAALEQFMNEQSKASSQFAYPSINKEF